MHSRFWKIAVLLLPSFAFANGKASNCPVELPPLIPQKVLSSQLVPDLGQEYTFTATLDGQSLPVKYSKYLATIVPAKGTMIFLCGGPGAPCTGMRPQVVPPEYNVVTLDYLGIGRNSAHNKPAFMAIESQGKIVAQVAEQLKEPNLILYAQSFGTTVATVAGSLIKTKGSSATETALKGVILEGVYGPANGKSYEEGYLLVANQAWSSLQPNQKEMFKLKYREAVEGLSEKEKLNIDATIVMHLQSGAKATSDNLTNINPKLLRDVAKNDFYTNFLNRPGVREIFQAAGCQMIQGVPEKRVKIFDDTVDLVTMATGAVEICKCRTVSTDFNPNSHQIKAPIVYINGGQDPATPVDGARRHFEGQVNSNKVFISSPNGGHTDSFGLLKECMPKIFDDLFENKFEKIIGAAEKMSLEGCSTTTSGSSNPAER